MSNIKQNTVINHPDGVVTLQEIQNDVDAWKTYSAFNPDAWGFTAKTVQALIDKIVELQEVIHPTGQFKYKVGDKVRIVVANGLPEDHGFDLGEVVTIAYVKPIRDGLKYRAENDDDWWWLLENEIEPAQSDV